MQFNKDGEDPEVYRVLILELKIVEVIKAYAYAHTRSVIEAMLLYPVFQRS